MLHYRAVAKNLAWKVADVALCIFGFIVMAYTTSLTVISWASGDEEKGLPSYCDKRENGSLF
jgi:proton-coupled amino acid transporter